MWKNDKTQNIFNQHRQYLQLGPDHREGAITPETPGKYRPQKKVWSVKSMGLTEKLVPAPTSKVVIRPW